MIPFCHSDRPLVFPKLLRCIFFFYLYIIHVLQVYEGAVYMHQGRTYLVKDLDISKKIAFCEEADLKYYTKTRDYTDIHIIGGKTVRCTIKYLLSFV